MVTAPLGTGLGTGLGTALNSALNAGLESTPAMDAVFSDTAQVQAMLRFEAAVSGALEETGLAPPGSACAVEALLEEPFLTADRAAIIAREARASGNIAIPFIKLLTAVVAARSPEAAGALHTGATSQDVLDTALVLCMREGFALLLSGVATVRGGCVALATQYAETPMAGRTWLQQGPPVTLGLKFAGAAAALARQKLRLERARDGALRLQLGGAVGTLASLGGQGERVSAAVARRLELTEAPLPWHTHRDSLAEVAGVLGNLLGTLGKIARDISLMTQTEVAEVAEPAAPGRGGSSTMPHKRNPVGCAAVLAAAVRGPGLVATMLAGMVQEHERGLGGWQAEWPVLPEIFRLTAGALAQMEEVVGGLEVDEPRLRRNLELTQGLVQAEAVVAALAPRMGRSGAHHLVEQASRKAVATGKSLLEVLVELPEVGETLSEQALRDLLAPANYLGSTAAFIRRGLAAPGEGSNDAACAASRRRPLL